VTDLAPVVCPDRGRPSPAGTEGKLAGWGPERVDVAYFFRWLREPGREPINLLVEPRLDDPGNRLPGAKLKSA
jgi:hypothetical protein